ICPSNGGRPHALLIMMTAAEPASSPNTARATRAQVPRTVTTTMPAVPLYSALVHPREMLPSALRSTLTGNEPLGIVALLALMAVTVPAEPPPAGLVRVRIAPGETWKLASIAATERTPSAVP